MAATETDAKLWRRYLNKVTPERPEWSGKGHRIWLGTVSALVVLAVVLGAINAGG